MNFIGTFISYSREIIPALLIGFFLSGLLHEFIPGHWIDRHLGGKGMKGIFYSTLIGTIIPVCCWGSLPIAVSLYMKGATLGPIFAILIATPATSINALIVTGRFLGLKFAFFMFFAVIFMGLIAGIIGNMINVKKKPKKDTSCECPTCDETGGKASVKRKSLIERMKSVLKFAYIKMPKEIGVEVLLGLGLAALISSFVPLGSVVKTYLAGNIGYLFSVVFGTAMYMCATMSVPLVTAFINQGMTIGAGVTLLLIGPITSYGTILVLRKEFGLRITLIYIGIIWVLALFLGYFYGIIQH